MKVSTLASLAALTVFALMSSCAAPATKRTPLPEVIDDFHAFAARQYTHLLSTIEVEQGYPRTVEDGKIHFVTASDWTAGYFPGTLWFLYEATGDEKWREAAAVYTAGMESQKYNKNTHDLGIMMTASLGHGLRLTKNPAYRDAMLTAAASLATRYNPTVRAIQSWPLWEPQWSFPVIIDNMMNLELLLWAADAANEPKYREIAIAHADTTLKHHFRPDGSSYHLLDYDTTTGLPKTKKTFQGAADDSSWARGQGWAIYGYSLMYRETKNPAYLAHAQKIAEFIMNHPRLPADKIPYWDFDAPNIPDAPRDTAGAAIIAAALIEMREFVDRDTAERYSRFAEQQLRSLASPAYRAKVGENGGFLLMHATGHLPAGKEIDAPLNYADYYFLEALHRYQGGKPLSGR